MAEMTNADNANEGRDRKWLRAYHVHLTEIERVRRVPAKMST